MPNTRIAYVLMIVLTTAFWAGCGKKGGGGQLNTVAVKGTVYLDGKAHGPGKLTLTPVSSGNDESRPTLGGEIGSDGTFTLTTYEQGDGAPPGDYSAKMSEGDVASTDPTKMMAAAAGVNTNPLTVTIPEEGSDSLEIRFVSSKKKRRKGTLPGTP